MPRPAATFLRMRTVPPLLLLIGLAFAKTSLAQEALTYQEPPAVIAALADAEPAPRVLVDEAREHAVLLYRDNFATIAELAEEELRLAGLRIDPRTNIGSRTRYYTDVRVMPFGEPDAEPRPVTGLPAEPRLANLEWSPDQRYVAMTHTAAERTEAWVLDVAAAEARRLADVAVNANLGDPLTWLPGAGALLVKTVAAEREPLIDTDAAVPTGPTVSVSDGRKAQNRTYQDLLSDAADEHNFEQLALSALVRVGLDGATADWAPAAMYADVSASPDGAYVLAERVKRPFSYLVPYYRFASETTVHAAADGAAVATAADVPLIEDLPKGFMAVREGRRSFAWRDDRPATLVFAEALDGGDPANDSLPHRDRVSLLAAPFTGEPTELLRTRDRFSGIDWGGDELAVAYDYWWDTRNTRTYAFDPSEPAAEPRVLFDRNYQDRYSDPGDFVMRRNEAGREVLALDGDRAFLLGEGYTPEGQFPFLDALELSDGTTERLYRSPYRDRLEELLDYEPDAEELLVRIESPADYPNYYLRDLGPRAGADSLVAVTDFDNPFAAVAGAHKRVLSYRRDDGLPLSGTLYLPPDYDTTSGERLPLVMWAYPREFKDRSSAGQTTANPNAFTYPYYGSPVYWVLRGYAVLDGASFPIVGAGDEEPNDTFREQLVANAAAAIDALDSMGYVDPARVGVGGHSYGAFMVANLLSHSDLFAAGVARSGAYNRTLTPFGFQSEQRDYWEAPEVYYTMSPFMHADKMKTPLLLVHGEADNNSGTYPMQSERYFNALKGLGAPVRLVMLPRESHGYRARESVMHLLWEQDQWLERYVKNAGADAAAGQAPAEATGAGEGSGE